MLEKEAHHPDIMSDSGALSHTFIGYPPLRCGVPETNGLYYDDGNKLILSPTSDRVLSWKVGSLAECDAPNSDFIGEGPALLIRYSLDKKIIAVQRTNHEIQFVNRESGESFIQKCKMDGEKFLGFFWTDCPFCDVVLIKTSGLDWFSYESEFNRLRLVESKRLSATWYVYTHESRLVILASGMQCKVFYGFQFSSAGVVRLPKFEMKMVKAESNQKPVLCVEDVHIVTIYGRIYCLQLDKVDMQVNMYRFYRDAVIHQGTLPVYSRRIAVSVVDNTLLVHQLDARVVILYDVFFDSLAPISAPLPLLLRASSKGTSLSHAGIRQTPHLTLNELTTYNRTIYGESWDFLVPDLVCDTEHGFLWKIHLDLEAIASSSSDVPSVMEFLQRRRSDVSMVKQLCLAMMRTLILERRAISVISRALNALIASYSQGIKMHGTCQTRKGKITTENPFAAASVNPSDVQQRINVSTTMNENVSRVESAEEEFMSALGSEIEQSVTSPEHGEPTELSNSKPNQPSTLSLSDSEDNRNFRKRYTTAEQSLVRSLSDNFQTSGASSEMANKTALAGTQDTTITSAAISPDELCYNVFAMIEEEMSGDPAYLVAVVIEFLRSVSIEKLDVHPDIYVMTIKLLVRSGRHAELGFFISNKIIVPSKEVSLQLIASGQENLQIRKLGMDMLRQLSLHHEYILVLLQDGYYIAALRYARKKKVTIEDPTLYLQATLSGNNYQHLAAVLRFFSDYIPDFQSTTDYNKYYQLLIGTC